MKILFISSAKQPDYQCDCLYHGLKVKYGKDVESSGDMWFMYNTLLAEERKYLYGKGFTLYGLLDSRIKYTPKVSLIEKRIKEKYYKYIIYGSVSRDLSFLDIVSDVYQSNEIIFVDGEDISSINEGFLRLGIYFKRELVSQKHGVYPISFGIPEEKIIKDLPAKKRKWAFNYPGRLNTYVYQEEKDYYNDYQSSYYATTFKKAGWDCLRHYEIIANGCLPYFKDIFECPPNIIKNFPKKILEEICIKINKSTEITAGEYEEYVVTLLNHCRAYLTTEKLAEYVIETASAKTGKFNRMKPVLPDEDIYFINNVLEKMGQGEFALNYSGMSSIQKIRLLNCSKGTVYAEDKFISAQISLQNVINDSNVVIGKSNMLFDIVISDMILPYEADVHDYMIKIIGSLNNNAKVIFTLPNYLNYSTILNLRKGDFKFGRLEMGKGSQVNFYSRKTITKFLNSYGFAILNLNGFEYDNKSLTKRWLNKQNIFKYIMCKKIIIAAELKNE